ncbi:unnamed protein product [Prorocentrum cordatum]|uniref:RNA helicase n=1 Tax=Prorocentrum cordatum TaxID=2364126 RepID=A0ABN9UA42_9DINO|nr:unnamed protein product [Polarella glacialis]
MSYGMGGYGGFAQAYAGGGGGYAPNGGGGGWGGGGAPPPSVGRGPISIARAVEEAGRGATTGMTVQDTDISVYDPNEQPVQPQQYATFEECRDIPREILGELKRAGFPGPSQIQAYTWPLAMQNKDVIGIAATGSGKTLAFLLPAFAEMQKFGVRPERSGPGLLVMSPTRELAQQTEDEANRFGQCIGFRCVAMYGGSPKRDQISKYRMGVHTIVACPGRLNDFLEGGQVRLDGVGKLVLDEADRMLDMGFEPQIRKILDKVPRRRHTLFFTATWPKEVRRLAAEILYQPFKVMIGNRDELKGNQDVIQVVRVIDGYQKERELMSLMSEAGVMNPNSPGKVLVFASTKRMCEDLSRSMQRNRVPCQSIHGDKDQREREQALNGLKTGSIKVLVATDVAARGLDIKGVGLVVNYDPANNTEDYVHRIGRTARAGAKGYAVTFFTRQDGGKARGVIEVMERTNQEVPQELRDLAGSGGGGGGRDRWGRGGGGGGGRGGGGGDRWGDRGGGGGGYGGSNSVPLGRGRSRSPRRW